MTTTLLIKGGRVYDHDGDQHQPPIADILIEDTRIARIAPSLEAAFATTPGRTIDARGKLVVPGFVNAHYHSHDTLLKGCFETIPLEMWLLNALPPSWPKRSTEEVRARTLIGAVECIHSGITTIQDMLTIYPFDPEHVETALDAYDEIGLRAVFALQIGNQRGLDRVPFWKEVVPADKHHYLSASVEPFAGIDPLDAVEAEYLRGRDSRSRVSWGFAPTSPEYCSPDFLERLADMSVRHDLPVYTHIYESKSMALAGRFFMPEHDGSQIKYLRSTGMIGPRLSLAHSVWMLPEEIEIIAETGTNIVCNPVGNLKTKSGVPPIREYLEAGINVGIGCDNSSCSDAQNMFQAMKMFASLTAVSHVEPGPPLATDVLRSATICGARTAGLDHEIGEIREGYKADLAILDLGGPSFIPFNSAARQLVFSEGGQDVETVIIDGQVVMEDRQVATINESELKDAVEVVMEALRVDLAAVQERSRELEPYLREAWRRSMAEDIGLNRFVGNH